MFEKARPAAVARKARGMVDRWALSPGYVLEQTFSLYVVSLLVAVKTNVTFFEQ